MNKTKKRYHYTEPYLLNPTHPATVILAGCGGTGSRMLTSLAMMHASLLELGHPGLFVTVYDGDTVQRPNTGRQLFYGSDLGLNKAVVLVSRVNRAFGTGWEAVPEYLDKKTDGGANIYITCTDTVKSRIAAAGFLIKRKCYYAPPSEPFYWLDCGNRQKTGQAVLGTLKTIPQPKSKKYEPVAELPTVSERFDLSALDDKDSGPSCSHARALSKQDLFINTALATLGCHLLWELFREGRTDKAGLYLNLETLRANAIPV